MPLIGQSVFTPDVKPNPELLWANTLLLRYHDDPEISLFSSHAGENNYIIHT